MQATGLDFPPRPQITVVIDGLTRRAVDTATLKSALLSSD
jgi:hypothetical protein